MSDETALTFQIRAKSDQARQELSSFGDFVRAEVTKLTQQLPGGQQLSQFSNTLKAASQIAGEGFAAIAAGAAGVATGVLAAGGAAIAAGTMLFKMAESASEAGAKMYDLSQKAAVSVETFSAFAAQGAESGVSAEQLSNAFVKLANNLALADSGSKRMIATLSSAGIKTFNDNEKAIREFVEHFVLLRTEQERTQAASAVFGQRTGASLVAMFNDVGGNVDAFIERMRLMGRVISTDFARDADRFSDLTTQIGQQVEGIERDFVSGFLPALGDAMQIVSNELRDNSKGWASWGSLVTDEIYGIIIAARALRDYILTGGLVDFTTALSVETGVLSEQIARMHAGQTEKQSRGGTADYRQAAAHSGGQNEPLRILEQQNKAIQDEYRRNREALEREYRLQLTGLADFTKRAIDEEDNFYKKRVANLNKQLEVAKKGSEREKIQRELDEAEIEHNKNIQKLRDEQAQRELEALREHQDALLKLQEEYDQQSIENIKAMADRRAITQEQAEQKIFDIQLSALNRQRQVIVDAERRMLEQAGFQFDAVGTVLADTGDFARVNEQAFQKLVDSLAQVNAQIQTLQQNAERLIEQARERDFDNEIKQITSLDDAELTYAQNDRELEEARLMSLTVYGTPRISRGTSAA